MVRPVIGTLIVVAALGVAARSSAELPMSPVFRTDQPSPQAKPVPTEHAEPAIAAAPKPATPSPAAKAVEAKPGASKVVATAVIPPPPSAPSPQPPPPSATVEPAVARGPTAVEHAANRPRTTRHAARPHYASSPNPYLYRYYSAWGASGPPHLGPNPYSPNGGD